jgi:gamma-glutamyltranspeptidase/glutathione hydrolase
MKNTSGCSYHRPRSVATRTRTASWARAAWLATSVVMALARGTASAAPITAYVATEHPLAVAAGLEVLADGGNAVDAAIAAAAAIGVVNPLSCGIGGGGLMLIYHARTGEAHAIDYREVAPAASTPAALQQRGVKKLTDGPLSVGVPGEPAGLRAAHERFGSLAFDRVLAPAIRHAHEGFRIQSHLAAGIARQRDLLAQDPELASVFLHDDGTPRAEGELLRQPRLAATLRTLVQDGAAPFYEGPIAAAIADTIAARGGILTAADLRAYRVQWRTPLRGNYRGRTVITMPPPSSGGIILEALNVLAPYDLRALGHGSPTYLHLLASTMQAVFADRARYYGDPAFVDIPLTRLLSAGHAQEIRQRLSMTKVLEVTDGGGTDAGTSHISVTDGAGNATAVTTTINTSFGSGIVARGTGIILNNEMADFNLTPGATNVFGLVGTAANVIAPGKRPLSSMSPTVVLHHGRPEIVIGGSGGPMIITSVLQTALGLIDFALDAGTATRAPRVHHQGVPPLLFAEPTIPDETRAALTRIGHTLQTVDAIGGVSTVHVGPDSVSGSGAPRKGGAAAGLPLAPQPQ